MKFPVNIIKYPCVLDRNLYKISRFFQFLCRSKFKKFTILSLFFLAWYKFKTSTTICKVCINCAKNILISQLSEVFPQNIKLLQEKWAREGVNQYFPISDFTYVWHKCFTYIAKFYLYRLVPSLCMIVVAKGVNLFYPNVNLLLHVNITMCKVWNKSYIPVYIYFVGLIFFTPLEKLMCSLSQSYSYHIEYINIQSQNLFICWV